LFMISSTKFALKLNQLFASQWMVLGGEPFPFSSSFYSVESPAGTDEGSDRCALYFSFPGNPTNVMQEYFNELLYGAREELYIQTPYLMDEEFWKILADVESSQSKKLTIITCLDINDHPEAARSVRQNMPQPFIKGVSLYDYSGCGRFSHWNIALDVKASAVFHGSYNLTSRSANENFEASVLVRSGTLTDEIRQKLKLDIEVGRLATIEDLAVSEESEEEYQATVYFC